MKFRSAALFLLVLCVLPASGSAIAEVSFREQSDSKLEILIDGSTFAVLNHGADWNKPFLYPVHASNGKNVLRPIIATKEDQGSSKEGTDHFHHKGVWLSVDSVNREMLNFWHESSRIVTDKVTAKSNSDGTGTLTLQNSWLQDDKPLLKETTTITVLPTRLLTYHIEIRPVDKDVTFHDTKEGFFAVRVASSMREMEGGHIVNADGLKGEKQAWGKPSPWVDYYGPVDGEVCGVTLMDHPENFRPSRYHVRGYGLFGISPFGPKKYSNNKQPAAPVTLSPGGEPLKLTYGLYVHNGDTETARVAEAYQTFLKATD